MTDCWKMMIDDWNWMTAEVGSQYKTDDNLFDLILYVPSTIFQFQGRVFLG